VPGSPWSQRRRRERDQGAPPTAAAADAFGYPKHPEDPVQPAAPPSRLDHWFLAVLVPLAYGLVSGLVLWLEYRSESSKVRRGISSDTFSPFVFTDILSAPTSIAWPDSIAYRPELSEHDQLNRLGDALPSLAAKIVLQALVIAVSIYGLQRLRRAAG
jgi:hypothetical protein